MIEESPGTFTPLEVARNRLAKAIFGICLLVVILAISVNQSADEFSAAQQQLQERIKKLREIEGRLVSFMDVDTGFLTSQLESAFTVMCLTMPEAEQAIGARARGSHLLIIGERGVNAAAPAGWKLQRCNPGFIEVRVERVATLTPIAAALNELLIDRRVTPADAIKEISNLLLPESREPWNLLLAYWTRSGLEDLIRSRWLDWPSNRSWLRDGYQQEWTALDKQNRVQVNGYGWGGTNWGTTYWNRTLVSLNERFKGSGIQNFEVLSQDWLRIRLAEDPHKAFGVLQLALADAAHELKGLTPDVKWASRSVAGVNVPLLRWLEWAPLLVATLLSLFVLFDQRAQVAADIRSSDFWFPRLGRPRDPLGSTPKGAPGVAAAVFWCTFWLLPALVCYWGVLLRFNWQTSDIIALERALTNHLVDWWSALSLLVVLFMTAEATCGTDAISISTRASRAVGVLVAASAAGACILVLMDYFRQELIQGGRIWHDGHLYLASISILLAGIGLLMRRRLSRLCAVLLIVLAYGNFLALWSTVL